MMPLVYVEGIGNVSFPDGMSEKDMERAINSMMKERSQPEMGGLERFGRGALQSVKDIGYGVQQLGAGAGQRLGVVDPETVSRLRREQDLRATESAPFMDSTAGALGYAAGSIGSMLLPGAALGRAAGLTGRVAQGISAPRTLTGAAAGGGALGALQPVGEEESRMSNVAAGSLGGMAGQALARGVSRLAAPSKSMPTPQAKKAIETLQAAGVPVDLAEATGSENLRALRRFLTDNPISASTMKKGQEATQTAFNRAALKLIGEQGDAAVPEVLARADDRIGSVMDNIAKNTRVKVDGKLFDAMARLENEVAMQLSPEEARPLLNQINNILSKVSDDDAIPGSAYQNARRLAGNLSAKPGVSPLARELREALDDALQSSVSKAEVDAIKLARKQYRNLMRIQESIGTTELGDISIPRLAQATSTKRERGAALMNRGDAELARLARSANTLRDAFPQSGTAPRAALQAYGQALAPGLAGAGYGAMQGESPSDAVLMGLTGGVLGLGLPAGMARAYQNPALRNYILRGAGSNSLRGLLASDPLRGAATYTGSALSQ
jgi:hypothetical protein